MILIIPYPGWRCISPQVSYTVLTNLFLNFKKSESKGVKSESNFQKSELLTGLRFYTNEVNYFHRIIFCELH